MRSKSVSQDASAFSMRFALFKYESNLEEQKGGINHLQSGERSFFQWPDAYIRRLGCPGGRDSKGAECLLSNWICLAKRPPGDESKSSARLCARGLLRG